MIKKPNKDERKKFKVLLIEDDEDDYVYIRDLLNEAERSDLKLDWVSNYYDGMESIIRGEYDVCLLDYRLGDKDGISFLNESKTAQVEVPIIILTGQKDYGVDLDAMLTGASDYLVKDQVNSDILERVIRYSINRARTTEALRRAQEELEDRVKERTAELETACASVERSSAQFKLFAYSVVHDLKSPAISVYGLSKRITERYGDNLSPKVKEYCSNIMHAAEQINSLVEEINIFIATKESRLKIESLDLVEVLEEIYEEYEDTMRDRGISFRSPIAAPIIKADRFSVMRSLRNLIDNALKYGGEELKTIEIDFEENDRFFIISVSDDGVGLNIEDTERIFEPFRRSGTSKGTAGTGLGLFILKEIAEKHKGDVQAKNRPQKGITFTMSISKDLE